METTPKPAGISGLQGLRFIPAESGLIVLRRCRMHGPRTDIGHHLATYPPVASIDEILRRFLVEMSKLD